jgi:hypothetical protein
MTVAESKRETLLKDIELTRQQMCLVIGESRRGAALLLRKGRGIGLLTVGAAGCAARIWLPLLSTGVALIWLCRSVGQSSRGSRRRR